MGRGHRSPSQGWRLAEASLVLETSLGPLHRRAVYPWGLFFLQFPHLRSKVPSDAPIPRKQLYEFLFCQNLHFIQQETF